MIASAKSGGHVLLKALSGPQSGAEVILADGEYTLGSGQDDDLQFVDLSLKSGHARLRVEGRDVYVAGGAGSVMNGTGLVIKAGDDDWREVEPLELLQIGANKFAIGSSDANWADLSESLLENETAHRSRAKGKRMHTLLRSACVLGGGGLTVCVVVWSVFAALDFGHVVKPAPLMQNVEAVREVLDSFTFGSSIVLRQEADGKIYASGYVETLAERRALHDAVERAGLEANLRIWVGSSIRAQIASAVESFDVEVTFALSDQGVATFKGEILSDIEADRFFKYIEAEVIGISSVVSHVKSASTYFAEVKDLAKRSDVADTILLRLVDDRIEASGVVVRDKIDSWVGFIQSYAKRFADRIALTSYVQVVNDQGEVIAKSSATRLAGPNLPGQSGAIDLDLNRIKQGSLGAADVFRSLKDDETAGLTADALATPEAVDVPTKTSVSDKTADKVFEGWGARAFDQHEIEERAADRYLPLILNRLPDQDRCWEGSQLHVADIPNILFWLDYLSMSRTTSLITFDTSTRYLILEAALNPDRMQQCAREYAARQGTQLGEMSLYLTEVSRNPLFIRYLVRDFLVPSVDVAGVMLRTQGRFVQLRDGSKVREGGSISLEAKLTSIGSLGALLQDDKGAKPLIYNEKLAWKVTD